MPLFVPILRVAMLFLNVYDSYKTLKPPPPSSRDPTRPSVRALSQRKRDMKGCLAVWIVWCCFTTYERLIENLVSLFIPFYNEVKSMVMLFLILTRARGAEPIFLHLLRPLIRPYSATLDATLDVLRMIGDFVFALSVFPLQFAVRWWHKSVHFNFNFNFEVSDSDSESTSDTSSNVEVRSTETPDVTPSTSAKRTDTATTTSQTPPPVNPVDAPKRPSPKRPTQESRRSSGDTIRSTTRQLPKAGTSQQLEPNFYNTTSKKRAHRSPASSQHQIWYPPQSAYSRDEDEEPTTSLNGEPNFSSNTNVSTEIVELTREEKEDEEWRQYPPFPSAYPPTPLVTTSRLVAAAISTSTSLYPTVEEELPQQDFHESLLPPRKPLNPGFVDGLSDQHFTPRGIPQPVSFAGASSTAVETENDSISDDEDGYVDEEEDIFNMTLRTPLPPYGSLRSRTIAKVSPSVSSAASVPSRSTALTTAANGSSLRTRSSSESSSSLSASISITDSSSSLLELAKSHPETATSSVLARVRQFEASVVQEGQHGGPEVKARRKPPVKKRKVSRPQVAREASTSETADDDGESVSVISSEDAYIPGEQKAPEVKRRRIIASPKRVVGGSRVVRPRVTRHASPPLRSQQPASAPLRKSTRTRSGGASSQNLASSSEPAANTLQAGSSGSSVLSTKALAPVGRKSGANPKSKV